MSTFLVKANQREELWTSEGCYITELSNTALAPAGSLAIARVVAGATTQLHALSGITETYIVIEGAGMVEVDGQSSQLGPGDQAVIPAGVSQKITALGEKDLRFYCLCTPRFVPGAYVNLE